MHRLCRWRVLLPILLLAGITACGSSSPPVVAPGSSRPRGPQKHPDLHEKYRQPVRQLEELGAVVVVRQGVPVEVDAGAAGVSSENLDRVFKLVLRLDTLQRLYLTEQPVRSLQLEALVRLPQLQSLNLDSVPDFSDQDLASLAKLEQLRVLTLRGTGVSAKGVAQLRKANPELLITY